MNALRNDINVLFFDGSLVKIAKTIRLKQREYFPSNSLFIAFLIDVVDEVHVDDDDAVSIRFVLVSSTMQLLLFVDDDDAGDNNRLK